MGISTTLTGLLPTYAQVGFLAPFLLVVLRLLQGLALGGEYGGAATYIAEHSPDGRRGYYTSFIQTTATVGLFVALIVVLISRLSLGDAAFRLWGWRIPFILSAVMLALALYIRMRLQESPLFAALKAEGKSSKAPLRDSLGSARNWRMILLALLGATAGQAVVWYTGQFYAQIFLQSIMKVNFVTATILVATALAIGTPFFIFFGSLSDRIGRKKIIMSGCLIAALTYIPIYRAMLANKGNPVVLVLLLALQVLYVTMVYGPIAAFLVEYFRASIRYTSMSLPYHLGNGWFGGFTPLIASAIVAKTGNPTSGLYYPIAVALMTFVIGSLFLPETKDTKIWDEVGGEPAAVQAAAGAD
jgi:MFS family permease